MARKRLEDEAVDRSRSYEMKRRASERAFNKQKRNAEEYSRTLEIAINLYDYIQNTPGMNRALLAEKLNVSQAYICNLINGKLNPSIKTIEKYEKILSAKLLPEGTNGTQSRFVSSLPAMTIMSSESFYQVQDATSYGYANSLQVLSY